MSDEAVRLGPLGELIGYQLRRASVMVNTDFTRIMTGAGLRQPLIGILSLVKENEGINQTVIAHTLGIQPANVVRLINEMIDKDWLVREVSPEDRRASQFKLTRKGQSALTTGLALSREQENRLFAELSDDDKKVLFKLLARINTGAALSKDLGAYDLADLVA